MNRILTTVILALFLFTTGSAQERRMILLEEFTNASGVSCAVQNAMLDELLRDNAGRVVPVKYHVGWPGPDPVYDRCRTGADHRVTFYGIPGVPHLKVNGQPVRGPHYDGAPVNLTQRMIDSLGRIPAPFQLRLTHVKSRMNDSLEITLLIRAVEPVRGNLAAFVAVEETGISLPAQEPGAPESQITYALRRLLPDRFGTELPDNWQPGDSLVIRLPWRVSKVFDHQQLCVAAWIQDLDTRTVHQAAFSPPVGPGYLDAALVRITNPGKQVCGNSFTPSLVLKNLGGIPLTRLSFRYAVNEEVAATFTWNGYLEYLEETEIRLPPVSFHPKSGGNTFFAYAGNPNGKSDSVAGNNMLVTTFFECYTCGTPVTVEIFTDAYPRETLWKIIDAQGSVVASGGPYMQANTIHSQVLDLDQSGCYEFIISDQHGDGLCCRYGDGFYRLKDQRGIVFLQRGEFGEEESSPFRANLALTPTQAEFISDFQVFPNPFDNTATISLFLPMDMNVTLLIMNEVGQIVYTLDKIILEAGSHTFDINGETWTPGVYFVKILAGDKILTKKLSLTK